MLDFDLKGLTKPIGKLIAVVSKGIGTVYRPHAIRSEADAEAYKIRALAAAKADAKLIEANGKVQVALALAAPPIVTPALAAPSEESMALDTAVRAKARVLTKEVEAQLNIEAIVDQAAANLPSDVSDAPVDDGWRRKFFTEAENVCDRDLQVLWGKILAGEVASPGRYSLRTLDVLKHLTKVEAELFTVAANLADSSGNIYLPEEPSSIASFGLPYMALLSLREAGLLHSSDTLHRHFKDTPQDFKRTTVVIANIWITIEGEALRNMTLPILALTGPGRELRELALTGPNEAYLKVLGDSLRGRGLTALRGTLVETGPNQGVMTFTDPL